MLQHILVCSYYHPQICLYWLQYSSNSLSRIFIYLSEWTCNCKPGECVSVYPVIRHLWLLHKYYEKHILNRVWGKEINGDWIYWSYEYIYVYMCGVCVVLASAWNEVVIWTNQFLSNHLILKTVTLQRCRMIFTLLFFSLYSIKVWGKVPISCYKPHH